VKTHPRPRKIAFVALGALAIMLAASTPSQAAGGHVVAGGHGVTAVAQHGFEGHHSEGHGFEGHHFEGHGFEGHHFEGHGFEGIISRDAISRTMMAASASDSSCRIRRRITRLRAIGTTARATASTTRT